MDEEIKKRLHLQNAAFLRIDHEDAMVAVVFKVTRSTGAPLIVKISERPNDFWRELYFLKHFAATLPVPQIVDVVQPEAGIHGAILMECLPGTLLQIPDLTDALVYEIGAQLARIHQNRTEGYGDLIEPDKLSPDAVTPFTLKFEEGLAECIDHLPKRLLEECRRYYDAHLHLLEAVDGPCMVHRDFRPGNMFVHEGKLQGIIDWASARSSFAEEDFCSLEHGEWPLQPSHKKSFLTGYNSIRPVPNYAGLMPLLRLSKAIATVGFTVKRGTLESSHARVYQHNRQFLESFLNVL